MYRVLFPIEKGIIFQIYNLHEFSRKEIPMLETVSDVGLNFVHRKKKLYQNVQFHCVLTLNKLLCMLFQRVSRFFT